MKLLKSLTCELYPRSIEVSAAIAAQYYEYIPNTNVIKRGRKEYRLAASLIKPECWELYKSNFVFRTWYLKDEYGIGVFRGKNFIHDWTSGNLKNGYRAFVVDRFGERVVANNQTVGKPKHVMINDQDIWNGTLHHIYRAKISEMLHNYFRDIIVSELTPFTEYPLAFDMELYDVPGNFDIGNRGMWYGKTFIDCLVREGIIHEDNVDYVTREPRAPLFRPIINENERKLVIHIYYDEEAANSPYYKEKQEKMNFLFNAKFPFEYTFPSLFTKDAKGNVRVFYCIVTANSEKVGLITTYAGLYGGKLTERKTEVTKGKNIGRSNATKPFEQAWYDADSKHRKKILEGYNSLEDLKIETKNDTLNNDPLENYYTFNGTNYSNLLKVLELAIGDNKTSRDGELLPMKAQKYYKDKERTKIRAKFPCYIQPKLNGIRCTLTMNDDGTLNFASKNGLEYNNLKGHIIAPKAAFVDFEQVYGTKLIFDGEIYAHGYPLQEIISMTKTLSLQTQLLTFEVFDLCLEDVDQSKRFALSKAWFQNYGFKGINRVETYLIKNHNQAMAYFDKWVKEGYEGAITRNMDAQYKFGYRSPDLCKIKKREDAEFTIINIIDTDKDPGLAIFICRNDINHEEFKVMPEGFTLDQRRDIYDRREQYIGKKATVAFYERTPAGIPFHANLVAIRDYE